MRYFLFFLLAAYLCCVYQCQQANPKPDVEDQAVLNEQKTYYSSGELKSKGYINEDSLREGRYQEYLPDGQLVRSIEYLDGRPHGSYVTFSAAGDTVSVHTYQEGLPKGAFRWYRANGQLQQEGEKVKGHTHGLARAFYENGGLQSLINYRLGQKYEWGHWFYPDGTPQRLTYFGNVGQECFQIDFTAQGGIKNITGNPIADLAVEANNFKGRIQLEFTAACPPESQYSVSLRKELGTRFQKLALRQNGHSFSWSERVTAPLPYSYAIIVSLRLPEQDSTFLYKQQIQVFPGKKIEYAIL